jgi:hypothetical protein
VLELDGARNLLSERVIAKEGDVLPGQSEAIADFETGAEESAINAAGQVLYGVDLAGSTSTDGAIYLDQTLLIMVNGQTIIDLSDITEQIHVAPDGSRMLVEGEINTGGSDLDVVIEVVFTIETNYCMTNPNSTGAEASISAEGSVVVADNDVTLLASGMPAGAFGYFPTSRLQGFVAMPGGSMCNLCLGAPIGRYVGPGQVQPSSPSGTFELLEPRRRGRSSLAGVHYSLCGSCGCQPINPYITRKPST